MLTRIRQSVDNELHNSLNSNVFLCREAEYREDLIFKHSGLKT